MKLPPPPPPPSVLPPPPPPRPVKIDSAGGADTYSITGHPQTDSDAALRARTVRGFPMPPDSLAAHTQAYFQSREWKQYQQQMARYGAEMAKYGKDAGADVQRYFNGPEWKKYQQDLHQYAQDLKDYFHSEEWKANVEAIKRQAMEIRRQVANVQAQKALDSLNHALSGLTFAFRDEPFNGDIGGALLKDGLITDRDNYRMRLSDKGLFVNGKKQDRRLFEKYRRMVGPDTQLEVRVKNGNSVLNVKKENKDHH
jgi:hypothetical protein